MTPRQHPWTPRPTSRELIHELRTVAEDLPRFLTAPLYRRWHLRWGATMSEAASALPGDDLLAGAQFRATRAVTINVPPDEVWPWLVQIGCLRAGFYSNDLLDNLGHPSARRVIPQLQHLEVGQWVSMSPAPTTATAFRVEDFEVSRWLLWRKPDSTWVWVLTELPNGRTRLVTWVFARHEWAKPLYAVLSVVLLELGDFAMMRRMLLGIKERAEAVHR